MSNGCRAILLVLMASIGCAKPSWHAYPDVWANPELRRIHLRGAVSVSLEAELRGAVSAAFRQRRASGESYQDACNRLTEFTLADLLRQAEALGGNVVYEVEYRGRREWLSRPLCLRPMKDNRAVYVSLRGVAAFDPVGAVGPAQ